MLNNLDKPLHHYYDNAMDDITDIREMVNTLNIKILEAGDFVLNIPDEEYRTNIPKIRELIQDIDGKYLGYLERLHGLCRNSEDYINKLTDDILPKNESEYNTFKHLIKDSITVKNTDKVLFRPVIKDNEYVFEEVLVNSVSVVKLFTTYFREFFNFARAIEEKFNLNNRRNYIAKLKEPMLYELIDNPPIDYTYAEIISGIKGRLNNLTHNIDISNTEIIEYTNDLLTKINNNQNLYTDIFLGLKSNTYKI